MRVVDVRYERLGLREREKEKSWRMEDFLYM